MTTLASPPPLPTPRVSAKSDNDCLSADLHNFQAAVRKGLVTGGSLKSVGIIFPGGLRCSPFRVKAMLQGVGGNNWTSLVEFQDLDGNLVECELPWRILQAKPRDAIALLADRGFYMSHDTLMNRVLDMIRGWEVPAAARQVLLDRAGWTPDRNAFALTSGRVLCRADVGSVYRLAGTPEGKEIGKLQTWREGGVAALCVGNANLIFAVCLAFAAPLMAFTQLNSIIFHLYGTTSQGKTRALKTALSVWPGTGEPPNNWSATMNGLEAEIAKSSGILYALDELPKDASPELGNMIYKIANGTSKARAEKDGTAQKRSHWQTMVLSTGEYSVQSTFSHLGKTMTGGQGVRIIDIPVKGRFGVFDELHGHPNGHAFVKALDNANRQASGPAGMAFVSRLLKSSDEAVMKFTETEMAKQRAALLKVLGLSADDRGSVEIVRVLDAFALVAVAGNLATRFGMTGWPSGTATEAVQVIARRWFKARGAMPVDRREAVNKTRDYLDLHENRFVQIADGAPVKTVSAFGYCDQEYFYVLPTTFADIHGKTGPAAAASHLRDAGLLHLGGERNSLQFKMPSSVPARPRVYRISRDILGYLQE